MKEIKVLKERCPQNHICPAVRVCPVKAINQVGFNAPTIDKNKCIKCGLCVKFCPMKAIIMTN